MKRQEDTVLPEDFYLSQFLGAMALEFAMRQGLIDQLAKGGALPQTQSAAILRAMLQASGVLDGDELSDGFRKVLETRHSILREKLTFLRLSATDIALHFDKLLGNLRGFMNESATFSLFRYDQAKNATPDDIAATRPWVAYVTALSEAEAPALAPKLPLGQAQRLLEIGGNTGVIARAALDANPGLQAVVHDLPAVCAIAEEGPSHPQLAFAPGDARQSDWPNVDGQPPDAVLFKSVLHDWPTDEASGMIDRALDHMAPGGRLIICERGAFGGNDLPFSMTANLVFAPFYRPPEQYRSMFNERGLLDIAQTDVQLEMPFHIVSGVKP